MAAAEVKEQISDGLIAKKSFLRAFSYYIPNLMLLSSNEQFLHCLLD